MKSQRPNWAMQQTLLAAQIADSNSYERSQLFICTHNEPLSIVAMRVSNPDCSPAGINRCDTAPTPTGFAEIVGDEYQLVAVESLAWFTRSIRSTCQRGNQWEAL
jgi:hypothetical protein